MRILHVIPYYHPAVAFGGPVTISRSLAEDLVARGHEVTVLTTDVASRTTRLPTATTSLGGVRIHRLRNLSQTLAGIGNCYTPMGLRRAVMGLLSGSDVCHVFDYFTWLTYRAVERADRVSIPSVISPQGSLSLDPLRGRTTIKTILQRTLGKATVARASVMHAVTPTEADTFRGLGVDPAKIRVIPNGVALPSRGGDGAGFRARYDLGLRRVVLFVGRLLAGKGVDLLLKIAERWRVRADTAFVFVGPAENRPDLTSIGWHTPNVLLTGILSGDALEDAYAAATLFSLPSYSEGLPVTALEALARGIPCVLSDGCNLPEVVEAGAGRQTRADVDELETAIDALLREPVALAQMGARGRTLIERGYTRRAVLGAVERLYADLINRRGA